MCTRPHLQPSDPHQIDPGGLPELEKREGVGEAVQAEPALGLLRRQRRQLTAAVGILHRGCSCEHHGPTFSGGSAATASWCIWPGSSRWAVYVAVPARETTARPPNVSCRRHRANCHVSRVTTWQFARVPRCCRDFAAAASHGVCFTAAEGGRPELGRDQRAFGREDRLQLRCAHHVQNVNDIKNNNVNTIKNNVKNNNVNININNVNVNGNGNVNGNVNSSNINININHSRRRSP